jgi:protein-S-isoprenylcysteine O-methyltransferase Ste14
MRTDIYQRWARRQPGDVEKALSLLLGVAFFLFVIPMLLVAASDPLDRWLGLPGFVHQPANRMVAVVLGFLGVLIVAWSVAVQVVWGRGTPIPVTPTKALVTSGPYARCRNPMNGGIVLYYLAVAIALGSLATLGLVVLFACGLALYLVAVEEKELEARFGEAYAAYKRETPRFIPRFGRGGPEAGAGIHPPAGRSPGGARPSNP